MFALFCADLHTIRFVENCVISYVAYRDIRSLEIALFFYVAYRDVRSVDFVW